MGFSRLLRHPVRVMFTPPVWLEIALLVAFGALWFVSGHWSLMLMLAAVSAVNAVQSAIKPIKDHHTIRVLLITATVALVEVLTK